MLAAASIALTIGLLLMPIPKGGRLYSALGDLCHTPLFMGLTIGGLWLVEKARPAGANRGRLIWRCIVIGIALFVFGVGMELVQRLAGRMAAVHDAVANGMGVTIGVCIFMIWNRDVVWPGNPSIKKQLLALAAIALAFAWWTPIRTLSDEWKQRKDFPVLAAFDSSIEVSRWNFRDSQGKLAPAFGPVVTDELSSHSPDDSAKDPSVAASPAGDYALQVTFAKPHSSVTLVEMNPDWSPMQTLEFDLMLSPDGDQPQVPLLISVIDIHHTNYTTDLYQQVTTFQRGKPTHVSISRQMILDGPRDRQIDLTKIDYLTIGLANDSDHRDVPLRFYIDSVKLTLQD